MDIENKKLKTREELLSIVGQRPRSKKVIMVHGHFDVLHVGHVRHMLYAKEKADILIASLTCDAHITKGNYRPHVPQELRALHLAAHEIVDYVLIDENATAIESLRILQPDFYAKGFEYEKDRRVDEERATIDAYGGQMIFTPGDIVYSSSVLIEAEPPDIAVEKLLMLMQAEGITFDSLRAALDAMKQISVHVVGDTIVDGYTYASMIGSSTSKTPTISGRYERNMDYVGGAGIVAKHMRATGARVTLSTILGDDDRAEFVLRDCAAHGIEPLALIDGTRPTTHKQVVTVSGYRMLRLDTLDNRPISGALTAELVTRIAAIPADAVVFSDFRHGIFSAASIPALCAAIPATMPKAADSQVASRWGNILDFRGFDLITPNEREARFALGDQDSTVRHLAGELQRRAQAKTVILKCGPHGIVAKDGERMLTLDSFTRDVVDPVGAGDALLAYATLALKSGAVTASILGSIAAALECEQEGNIPITPDMVRERIALLERM